MPLLRPQEDSLVLRFQKWADGKLTLKDVRGYSDEELYAIARTAYFFYFQGKLDEARVLFQGLYAINPMNPYFAKALGVIEFAAGNAQGALTAYDLAVKLAPEDAGAYVGRAEVRLSMGQRAQALEDLRRAAQVVSNEDPLSYKVGAMLRAFRREQPPRSSRR